MLLLSYIYTAIKVPNKYSLAVSAVPPSPLVTLTNISPPAAMKLVVAGNVAETTPTVVLGFVKPTITSV
jgi:hypothetical protein